MTTMTTNATSTTRVTMKIMVLSIFMTSVTAFVTPSRRHGQAVAVASIHNRHNNNNNIIQNRKDIFQCNAILPSSLPSSVSTLSFQSPPSLILTATENDDVTFNDAFNDNIDLFGDTTVQLLFGGFAIFIILASIAKLLLNKMDDAIEKVLVEYESVMKDKYASRWVSIEAKLEGLGEPERSQKLFEIMEGLQESEPEFMKKVNQDMTSLL